MAKLFSCKSCDRQISVTAKACPNCGHDVDRDRQDSKKITEMIGLVILVAVFVIMLKTGLLEYLIKDVLLKGLKPKQ